MYWHTTRLVPAFSFLMSTVALNCLGVLDLFCVGVLAPSCLVGDGASCSSSETITLYVMHYFLMYHIHILVGDKNTV